MIPRYIKGPQDLVTTHKATCEEFLEQALAKTEKATSFVAEAKLFWETLSKISDVTKLLQIRGHRDQLLAAAGFSDKARNRPCARASRRRCLIHRKRESQHHVSGCNVLRSRLHFATASGP